MRCRHTEEKPFQCQYCPKSFSSQSNLRGHWSIHKDERPYLCSICGTAFKANSNLVKHTQRHLGDKRFSCTTCGKQFVTSTDLRRHFRVHSSEKSFLCELCPKSFKDATSLYRHAVCHTGEKNFLCTFCGDAFARKDNCYTHMKKHHTHETDLLPPPQRRLENYVHNSDQSDPEETAQASSFDHKPDEHKPVIPPLVIEPLSPIADQHKAAFCAPPVMTEVYLDNQHQAEAVMESQIPVAPMDKVPEGTYTQLMAVDDISSLNACKMPSQQQPYEMYIPMSMHGPSW